MVNWSFNTLTWEINFDVETNAKHKVSTSMHQWTLRPLQQLMYTRLDRGLPVIYMGSWLERWTGGQEVGVEERSREKKRENMRLKTTCWGANASSLCQSQWGSIGTQYNEQLTLNLTSTDAQQWARTRKGRGCKSWVCTLDVNNLRKAPPKVDKANMVHGVKAYLNSDQKKIDQWQRAGDCGHFYTS